MTPAIVIGLIWAVLLILIDWTFGQSAADREHRRRRNQKERDASLRSIPQDLDLLQREQQRLAGKA
jgi:hypothetical protein